MEIKIADKEPNRVLEGRFVSENVLVVGMKTLRAIVQPKL